MKNKHSLDKKIITADKNALDQIMEIINDHDYSRLPVIELKFFAESVGILSDLGLEKIKKEHFHKLHLITLILERFIELNEEETK